MDTLDLCPYRVCSSQILKILLLLHIQPSVWGIMLCDLGVSENTDYPSKLEFEALSLTPHLDLVTPSGSPIGLDS